MVTAHSHEAVIREAESLGLEALLVKPVTPSKLLGHFLQTFSHHPSAAALLPPPVNHQAASLAGARVLVVEDNLINQHVAREILEGFGLTVDIAQNGRQAVEHLAEAATHFDAVLMDVQMPGMDGYEATRIIRMGLNLTLPIIAMTAHALESERQNCLDAGMNDHVAKPIDPEQLLTTLLCWIAPGPHAGVAPEPRPQTVSLPTSPAALPGVDVPSALVRFSGDREFFFSLLHQFRREWSDVVARLQSSLAQAEWETAFRLAHSLRGSSATLSMPEVTPIASELEANLVPEKRPALQAQGAAHLTVYLERLKAALAYVLAGLEHLPPDQTGWDTSH